MQFGSVRPQDQRGTEASPVSFPQPLHGVATGVDRVMHPGPDLSCVDSNPHKRLFCIKRLHLKGDAPLVERGVIGGRRPSWLTLLVAAFFPVSPIRQIRPGFSDSILDHRATVSRGHPNKALAEVPAGPRVGMAGS